MSPKCNVYGILSIRLAQTLQLPQMMKPLRSQDKRVVRCGRRGTGGGSKLKPMFVQFALEPIWKVGGVTQVHYSFLDDTCTCVLAAKLAVESHGRLGGLCSSHITKIHSMLDDTQDVVGTLGGMIQMAQYHHTTANTHSELPHAGLHGVRPWGGCGGDAWSHRAVPGPGGAGARQGAGALGSPSGAAGGCVG